MQSNADLTHKWDSFGRLREVYAGATLLGQYSYDALSRRVRRQKPGEAYPWTEYHYDGWRVVVERIVFEDRTF